MIVVPPMYRPGPWRFRPSLMPVRVFASFVLRDGNWMPTPAPQKKIELRWAGMVQEMLKIVPSPSLPSSFVFCVVLVSTPWSAQAILDQLGRDELGRVGR